MSRIGILGVMAGTSSVVVSATMPLRHELGESLRGDRGSIAVTVSPSRNEMYRNVVVIISALILIVINTVGVGILHRVYVVVTVVSFVVFPTIGVTPSSLTSVGVRETLIGIMASISLDYYQV